MQGNEVRKDEIAADAHLEDLPAGTELMRGQYTIASYLNSGGFGITYCANDSLGRTVVIKECFPSIMCQRVGTNIVPRKIDFAVELSKLIEQFVSEAHALAALKHKNILHVHQVFEENDTAYMAIDFIDGPDLLDVIENDPHRLTPEEITRLTRRALGAIKYIHDKDILHRDISPDNILIDETGEPVLIDFGAARRNNTVPGRVFSKVKFVKDGYSPQEFYIEGAEQGPWSDLYSFAASMYHAIKGSAPVDGQQRMTAVAQGRPDPYEPLAGQIEGYPEGFLEAMDHALAILPRDRLQSADEWLEYIPTRPTRVRRSMIPSRRTRPAGETGSRNLSAVISPSDSVSETPVSIDDITAEPASDALPENEEFGPIAISREDDNDIATVFDDDDLDDDEPVDIRAESFIEPVPSSKKKQKATKSSPVQDQLAEKLKVAREGAATSMPIVPESDEFEDEAEFDDNVDLFEQDDQSTEELFEEVNAGLASRASTRSNSYPVSEEDTAPDHPDEEFDALETAIAETTEDAKGPVDEADLKLNRRISQIVVQSQQDMKAADEEDDTVIPLEPEDDTPEPVAALEHRKSSGKGIMYGLIAAALALVAAGLGWQFMGGSDDATVAQTQPVQDTPVAQAPATTASPSAPNVAVPAPIAAAPTPAADPVVADPVVREPEVVLTPVEVAETPALDEPQANGADQTGATVLPEVDVPLVAQTTGEGESFAAVIATAPSRPAAARIVPRPRPITDIPAVPPSLTSDVDALQNVTFASAAIDVPNPVASAPVTSEAGVAPTEAAVETALPSDSAETPRPNLSFEGVGGPEFDFTASATGTAAPTVAEESAALPQFAAIAVLGPAQQGSGPAFDATPPEPLPVEPQGALIARQVVGAHWDVAMPFASTIEQVRNSNTALITEVTDPNAAAMSGAWIAPDAMIYALNGETLRPGLTLSTQVLDSLIVDPDGYTRGSVRYRDPETGRIDRGLLAVPVVREIALADTTQLTYRTEDSKWVMRVKSAPSRTDDGLQPGDILISEQNTGIGIANEDALRAVFDRLVSGDVGTARFLVLRNGAERTVGVPLAREALE